MSSVTSISQVLADIIHNNVGSLANKKVTVEEAVGRCMELDNEGLLVDTTKSVDELRERAFRNHIEGILKSGSNSIKGQLVASIRAMGSRQATFDLGTDFDQPILVCGRAALQKVTGQKFTSGRVTTLGALQELDIDLMFEEQKIDLADKTRALEEFSLVPPAIKLSWKGYANYEAYITDAQSA